MSDGTGNPYNSRQRFSRLVRKGEAAERLDISVAEINRLMALGKLGFIKPTGSKNGPVRFSEELLEAWLKSNTFTPDQKGVRDD
jgi:excisionase family DNA binding protein